MGLLLAHLHYICHIYVLDTELEYFVLCNSRKRILYQTDSVFL
jgi:hypothetical protein